MDGRKVLKVKLLKIIEEKYIVAEAGTITGIPLIVEIGLVDVDIELTIVITKRVEAVQTCENSHHVHCRSKSI